MCDDALNEQNEYVELPDSDHLDTVMDGMIDTVTGNEGYTYAQHYLHGVLNASGAISSRTGVEGFFQTLGDGLKTAYEYVIKMFKSIWNFFFGKDEGSAEKEKADAKAEVDKDTAKIKEATKPTGGSKKEPKSPKEAPQDHHAKLKAAIDHMMEVGGKAHSSFQTPYQGDIHNSAADALHRKALDEMKKEGVILDNLARAVQTHSDVHDPVGMLKLQEALDKFIAGGDTLTTVIKRHIPGVKKEVEALTAKVNGQGHEDKESLNKDLRGMKALLTLLNNAAKLEKDLYAAAKAVSKANATLVI